MKRHENLARWIGAGLGVIGGFVLGYFMVGGVSHTHPGFIIIGLTTLEGLIFAISCYTLSRTREPAL